MYMYRAAVHSLDAEFTVLEMTTSNAFFTREPKICTIPYIFYLANVSDEINFFRAGGELCLRLSLEPDQTDNMSFVTI